MNHADVLRKQAREFHRRMCAHGTENIAAGASAEALLDRAEEITGIKRHALPETHPFLDGAVAKFELGRIWYNESVEKWRAYYYQAHEYAHRELGHGERICSSSDINPEDSEDKVPLGVHRVTGYGPHERQECDANLFAREFLLPGDVLRQWFVEGGLDAQTIAERVGVSIEMVCHQLARSLLTPDIHVGGQILGDRAADFGLDDSQKDAAHAPRGALLVEAGPGTGKTRALVGRVLFLLEQGVLAEQILVLTFSNKAAEELRERVARAAPAAAPLIKMETFHSFGLELLRKYGTNIGLPAKPTVLDPADALFFLEKSLPELGLDHYQNLYEPTMYLRDILAAISRAKDENKDAAEYTKLAQAMLEKASSPEDRVAAEKALEVARVYGFYQAYLDGEGLLDFGDLIRRSIGMLREHPSVRGEVRQTYRYVLVDEYQDVNRASGLLLSEVVGDGEGLWAVCDPRQSIYRWRGASPTNVRLFATDFPAAKSLPDSGVRKLKKNYRSRPKIVDVFAVLAPQMQATSDAAFTPWETHRDDAGGSVNMEIADDLRAEVKGIAREINRLRAAGVPLKEQAIICRSHTSLARIAQLLEEEEIPVLYLGDLFERPEVRDMLSLLALACEGDGRGLIRVARFPEYQIPLADVLALHAVARNEGVPFPQALDLAADVEGITPHGKEKLALLARQIDGLCHGRSAWKMIVRYLFVTSDYLRPLLADNSVSGQQRRLALYQFIQFAHSRLEQARQEGIDPKLSLLRYVRRLEIFGEERQLRQVPAWADSIDAVRVLTVHASKGLEFGAVYMPVLGGRYFPASKQPQPCPPPVGLIENVTDDWHLEEEECLYFVALSRARDHLFLSRAERYGLSNSNPSKFLGLIAEKLPRAADGAVTWADDGKDTHSPPGRKVVAIGSTPPVYHERQLGVYMKCPRKYFYEFVLGLGGKRDDSAYVQFHQCVYDVLHWMQYERSAGREVGGVAAQAYLDEIWQARGPLDHPYQSIYREQAAVMVSRAQAREPLPGSRSARPECEIKLPHGRVKFTLDHTELVDEGGTTRLLVQRLRTGKPSKSESDKPIYGLYQAAADEAHPKAERRLQILYLSTNEVKDVALNKKQVDKRLGDYDAAIYGILSEQFQPEPSDRECPRCPHYHICPLAEDDPE